MYTYSSINGLSKECFEDKSNENVEESLDPVDVDKAGSEASEEGTDGLSKIFAVLGYSKVGVSRSVYISTRGFVSAQYKCTEFLNPGTTGIRPEKILLTV